MALRSLLVLFVLALALPMGAVAIDVQERFADPAQQQRYENLIRNVRCLVCQNESIADSSAPLANDLRREIRDMMRAGASNEEILGFLTARYGDFVLYRPPFQPNTWLLWLAPVLLIAIGGGMFARILSARASQPLDDEIEDSEGVGERIAERAPEGSGKPRAAPDNEEDGTGEAAR